MSSLNQYYANYSPKARYVNPYWTKNDPDDITIYDRQTNKPFKPEQYFDLFQFVRGLFRKEYETYQTECQVHVFERKVVEPIKTNHPEITWLTMDHIDPDLIIALLPQQNSAGLTEVDEVYYQTNFLAKGIIPFMHIHSHHIMRAYQSAGDWANLNGNTLEVVIGNVRSPRMSLAYWLDIPNTYSKNKVSEIGRFDPHAYYIHTHQPNKSV